MEKIMTPMQELIDLLEEQYKRFNKEDDIASWFHSRGIKQAIKHAKSMLEKEKEVMCQFGLYCTSNGSLNEIDYVFNETFKTKEK